MNRRFILFLAVLVITASAFADANRVLLRPPDRYKGIDIGGVPFVMGQVYLPQIADTSLLKPFGFRDFQFISSSSRYKKIKAWWPLMTEVNDLPDEVLGLSYEKITEEDLAYAAIMQPDLLPSGKNHDEVRSMRYSQMHPADGKPHLMYKDQPYVEGKLFCSSEPDEAELRAIGIVLFHDFGRDRDDVATDPMYERWSAMWPMSLKESQLPYYIAGMIADNLNDYYRNNSTAYYHNQRSGFRTSADGNNNYYFYGSQSCYPQSYYYQSSNQNKYGYNDYKVNWTPAQRNNPSAYWYNTLSRTTLTPTTIGSYDGNKYLRKVRTYPCYRH